MTPRSKEVSIKQKMERDPVCGMNVDPGKASAKVEHAGKTYYFCAPGCAKRFQQAPEKYLQPVNNLAAPSGLVGLHSMSQSAAAAAPATSRESNQEKHA